MAKTHRHPVDLLSPACSATKRKPLRTSCRRPHRRVWLRKSRSPHYRPRPLAEERETSDPASVARADGDLRYGVFITPPG
jgi:hypothetical protein